MFICKTLKREPVVLVNEEGEVVKVQKCDLKFNSRLLWELSNGELRKWVYCFAQQSSRGWFNNALAVSNLNYV